MTRLRQRLLEELQRRNYAPDTTRGYILAVKQFAEYFGKSPDRLGPEQVRRFQLHLLNEKRLSAGTVKNRMSALRFFYRKALKRRDLTFDDLPFPRTPREVAHRAQSRGGDATHRCGCQSHASDHPDRSLWDRGAAD